MFSNRSSKDESRLSSKKTAGLPSILASDLTLVGNIRSDGMVDIDGKIEGNIRCHTATIRNHGLVKGDILAEVVHVYGTVQGLIKARNVQFFKGCRAEGVIIHETITIEDGAMVDGRFKRTENLDLDEQAAQERLLIEPPLVAVKEDAPLPGSLKDKSGHSLKTAVYFSDAAEPKEETVESLRFSLHDDAADAGSVSDEAQEEKPAKRVRVLENLRLISDAN